MGSGLDITFSWDGSPIGFATIAANFTWNGEPIEIVLPGIQTGDVIYNAEYLYITEVTYTEIVTVVVSGDSSGNVVITETTKIKAEITGLYQVEHTTLFGNDYYVTGRNMCGSGFYPC